MDANIINAIIQKQGAANTVENANRIREFGAANPDVMERYAMGAGPGLDDNSALLRLALDRSIASTELPPLPGSQPPMPSVQNASAPTRRSATAAPKQDIVPQWASATENPNLGPLPPRNASPGEAAAAGQRGGTLPTADIGIPGVVAGVGDTGGLSGWEALLGALGLLGTSAGVYALSNRNPNAAGRGAGAGAPNQLPTSRALPNPVQGVPQLPAPPKQLTYNPATPDVIPMPDQSVPPKPSKPQQSPADIARMQAEVDAENADQARQLQEQMKRQKAQKDTAATLKAGSRAVRGR